MSVSCVAHSLVFHCGLEKTVSRQPLIKTFGLCASAQEERASLISSSTYSRTILRKVWRRCCVSNQICLRGVQPDTHTYTQSQTNTQNVFLAFWPRILSNLYLICMWLIDWLHALFTVKVNYSLTLVTFWPNVRHITLFLRLWVTGHRLYVCYKTMYNCFIVRTTSC